MTTRPPHPRTPTDHPSRADIGSPGHPVAAPFIAPCQTPVPHNRSSLRRSVAPSFRASVSSLLLPPSSVLLRLRLVRDTGTWILPDRLLACSYPRRPRLQRALAKHRITTVVNLHTRPHPLPYRDTSGLHELHLPVPDFTAPTGEQLNRGVAAIHAAIDRGERVAVHCGAGLGRTGTLVACYLVSTGLTPDAAIAEVRRLRPGSIETRGQEAAIHAFAVDRRPDT